MLLTELIKIYSDIAKEGLDKLQGQLVTQIVHF